MNKAQKKITLRYLAEMLNCEYGDNTFVVDGNEVVNNNYKWQGNNITITIEDWEELLIKNDIGDSYSTENFSQFFSAINDLFIASNDQTSEEEERRRDYQQNCGF